jgi:hypothetical protein
MKIVTFATSLLLQIVRKPGVYLLKTGYLQEKYSFQLQRNFYLIATSVTTVSQAHLPTCPQETGAHIAPVRNFAIIDFV